MATYAELWSLLNNTEMQDRANYALTVCSRQIRAEVDTTLNHANRSVFANRVFSGALTKVTVRHVLMEILSNGAVAAAGGGVTDAVLQSVLFESLTFLVDKETA